MKETEDASILLFLFLLTILPWLVVNHIYEMEVAKVRVPLNEKVKISILKMAFLTLLTYSGFSNLFSLNFSLSDYPLFQDMEGLLILFILVGGLAFLHEIKLIIASIMRMKKQP